MSEKTLREAAQMALDALSVLRQHAGCDVASWVAGRSSWALEALRAALAAPEMMAMAPMILASGRTGWYISGPEFYCEIEPEPDGKYCIFFRDKSGNEGYFDPVDDQTATVEPAKPLTYKQLMDVARESGWPASMISAMVQAKLEQFARAIEKAHGIQGAKE